MSCNWCYVAISRLPAVLTNLICLKMTDLLLVYHCSHTRVKQFNQPTNQQTNNNKNKTIHHRLVGMVIASEEEKKKVFAKAGYRRMETTDAQCYHFSVGSRLFSSSVNFLRYLSLYVVQGTTSRNARCKCKVPPTLAPLYLFLSSTNDRNISHSAALFLRADGDGRMDL